jgi:hypothetical protein
MNDEERDNPHRHHGKGPPDEEGRDKDHGRPVPHHGSAAIYCARRTRGS